jgi:hypothetical protein
MSDRGLMVFMVIFAPIVLAIVGYHESGITGAVTNAGFFLIGFLLAKALP